MAILAMMIASAMVHKGGMSPEEANAIDIEKEYDLIKQKKSSLSANQRRIIVERVESLQKKVVVK